MGSFRIFRKNIKYLFTHLLSKERLTQSQVQTVALEEVIEEFGDLLYPNVKGFNESVDMLVNSNKSFVRFGDGEISLMNGHDIPFQKSSERLTRRLFEVLSSMDERLAIGVPKFIYSAKKNLNDLPYLC